MIEGGVPLHGEVRVSGAKNAVLPLMAASLLFKEPVTLKNVPLVQDVFTMKELLEILGAKVELTGHTLTIDASTIKESVAPYELVKKMRASIYVLGPLLARVGEAKVSLPGGCAFGPRPVNFHIEGLRKMGAKLEIEHGYIKGNVRRFKGALITFDKKSVGATAHLMMAASLAKGETIISNAALEPEVTALEKFLKLSGAKIWREEAFELHIEGVQELHSPGEFEVIPDRIETGTYLVAGLITDGEIVVRDCRPEHLRTVLDKLIMSGAKMEEGGDFVKIKRGRKRPRPVNIETYPYPGFPTDMQAQFMALMTIAEGTSIIKENIYPDRFLHAYELQRLGADIKVEEGTAIVRGVQKLTGAPVMASDLRASAALVLAGLVAEGKTEVSRIYHLDRGYERFEEKLKALGARIERTRE